MLKIFIKIIKRIFNDLGYIHIKIKCESYYFLQGGNGLSYVIEKLPKKYIIPILKNYGVKVGKGSDIDRGIILHRIFDKSDLKKLSIGRKTHLGHNMILDLSSEIKIGSYSAFGANCQIWTHTGNWTIDRSDELDLINPVIIGESVICYSGVIISQNVVIGDYSRVAAGSVVINDIEKQTFVGGVPAKIIKKLNVTKNR